MGTPGTPVAGLTREFSGEAFTGYRRRYGWRAVFDARQIRRGANKGQWEVWFKHATRQGLVWKRATVKTIKWKEKPDHEKHQTTESTGRQTPAESHQVHRRQGPPGPQSICQKKGIPAQSQFVGF